MQLHALDPLPESIPAEAYFVMYLLASGVQSAPYGCLYFCSDGQNSIFDYHYIIHHILNMEFEVSLYGIYPC